MKRFSIAFLGLGIACSAHSAETNEGTGAVNGDRTDRMKSAVAICRGYRSNWLGKIERPSDSPSYPSDFVACASGVLIAPNLVLTARSAIADEEMNPSERHCDTFRSGAFKPDYLMVSAETELAKTDSWVRGLEFYVPTEANPEATGPHASDNHCGANIALIRLERPVDGVKPAVPALDWASGPALQKKLSVVGYGDNDNLVMNDLGGDNSGVRRSADVKVVCTHEACLKQKETGTAAPAEGIYGTPSGWDDMMGRGAACVDGDVGAPLLYETKTDTSTTHHVAGIHIFARDPLLTLTSNGENCEANSTFLRLDLWKNFLVKSAIEAARAADLEVPAWTKDVAIEAPDAGSEGTVDAAVVDASIAPAEETSGGADAGSELPEEDDPMTTVAAADAGKAKAKASSTAEKGGCNAGGADATTGTLMALGFAVAAALGRRGRAKPMDG